MQAFSLSAQFARGIFFLPSPCPLSFFRPRTFCKGYYFYSPQSSTVEFKYRRVIAPHKDFVLLQRDPFSFPRISNFSYLLAAYNATIYAMTLKTKNKCFTVENLRFVHAVRMITTRFLAVFRFVWMRNVENVLFTQLNRVRHWLVLGHVALTKIKCLPIVIH